MKRKRVHFQAQLLGRYSTLEKQSTAFLMIMMRINIREEERWIGSPDGSGELHQMSLI